MKLFTSIIMALALAGCQTATVNDNTPHTEISGKIAGQPFSIKNPKDTILDGLMVNASTNGSATIRIEHLSTVMNPTNISNTGEAAAALESARGEADAKRFQALGGLFKDLSGAAGAFTGEAAKGAVTGH